MSFGPPKLWWHDPSLKTLDQHPIAHALGGCVMYAGLVLDMILFFVMPLPYWVALQVSIGQFLWEWIQVEVTPGYSFKDSGVWDWLTATLVAFSLAGAWEFLHSLAVSVVGRLT